ncbi:MAG: GGDEF domain-containing protein [Candidatus Micrarchaeota archaeon]
MIKQLYAQGRPQSRDRAQSAFGGRSSPEPRSHSEEYSIAIDRITSNMASTDIRELLCLIPQSFPGVAKVEIFGEGQPLVSAFVREDKVIFSGSSGLGEHFVRTEVPLMIRHSDEPKQVGVMHILSFRPLSLDSEHPNDRTDTAKVLDIMGSVIAKTIDAKLDGLTALPVRKYFDRSMSEHVARFQRDGTTFSLITLDIDHFKEINDQNGHDAGDRVLSALSMILQNGVRARADCTDNVFRCGGEEFAVILPGIPKHRAAFVAERLRKAIGQHDFGLGRPVTCSFGVAEISELDSLEDAERVLYKIADERMYEAKDKGRNSVVSGEIQYPKISQVNMKAVQPDNEPEKAAVAAR